MLHFYYGVMGSSKTAQLLMQRYNLLQLKKSIALIKPSIDTRAGVETVYSRVGLNAAADVVLQANQSVVDQLNWHSVQSGKSNYEYLLVDEAQFLTPSQVQELADLSQDVEIYCYGLKTDFMGNFFPGSEVLFRLAEDILEVPGGLCWCGKKATMNTRINSKGEVIKSGEQVLIDNQESIRYVGLCYKHWREGDAGVGK